MKSERPSLSPEPKPSVAIIGTRGYPSFYGGFETAVRKLAPYLVSRGWDVTVYGRSGISLRGDGDADPEVRVKITAGIDSKSLSTLSYGLTSTVDAARARPDVALVMNVANGFFLPLLRVRRVRTLINVDGIEWDRDKWGKTAKAVFHAAARFTARFGDRMVYDSREIARRWREEFKLDGEFIPYGGDQPTAKPVEPGLSHRGYVLVVARFVPENTVVEFVEAATELAADYPVVIVGSSGYGGEVEERVRQLSAESDNVHWLGHISDDERLLSLWQHAGAYYHGHSVGGTNPALVQAMACGAPTVARDTPYNREVIGNGIFCAPNSTAIAQAIRALMEDKELQAAESERLSDRARENYGWNAVCEAYENALLALIREQEASAPIRARSVSKG